jgi:glycosyltransferase involved in cell wall biosynthesis
MGGIPVSAENPSRRVAILYPYLAHYREAVFDALSSSTARHRYVIFSDRQSNIPSIATIPPERSRYCNSAGRLNWRFVRNRWPFEEVLWQSAALRIALSPEFDSVIFLGNVKYISTWVAAILARITGKRVLMWTHGILRREQGMRGHLRRAFYRLAHGLLLYGVRARDLLADQGFDLNRMYVIYNSLDTAAQLQALEALDDGACAAARRSYGIPANVPLLIAIGRLVPGKDLQLLPQALQILRTRGLEAHLLFIGDGPVRPMLENLARDLGIQRNVHFAGPVYAEPELCPLIAAGDLVVSPGPVGLTAMHALIYGTPVITHDDFDQQKPEFEAIEAGLTGVFFRRGDPVDLAETVRTWLSMNGDRRAVATRCRERVLQCYTPNNQRERIDSAVDGVPAGTIVSQARPRSQQSTVADATAPLAL